MSIGCDVRNSLWLQTIVGLLVDDLPKYNAELASHRYDGFLCTSSVLYETMVGLGGVQIACDRTLGSLYESCS